MKINPVCHQIVSDMKDGENEFQIFTLNKLSNKELFNRWLISISEYIDQHFNGSSNQRINKLSALILTSTQIIDDSSSPSSVPSICSSNNRAVSNMQKMSIFISQINLKPKLNDFTGRYAKEKLKFLFFDVSLDFENVDKKILDFTIQFLNKLVEKIELNNKKFATFDMRSTRFMPLIQLMQSTTEFIEFSYDEPLISVCRIPFDLERIICANYYRLGDPGMWFHEKGYYDSRLPIQLIKLIENGFQLNKFYYKTDPGFDEFVNKMKNAFEFRNLKIQTRLSKNILINSHFEKWLKTIREDFLAKYYDQFELDDLQMIVIGSSGVDNSFCRYNSLRALVAESWFTSIPPAVKTFIANLNKALCLEKHRGTIEKDNPNYDFECTQSMDHVLFINVCHSARHRAAEEWVNAARSIKFVNKILEKLANTRKIAILDLRITLHTHRDNLLNLNSEESCSKLIEDAELLTRTSNSNTKKRKIDNVEYRRKYRNLLNGLSPFLQTVGQDTTDVSCDEYYQNEDHFKVVNPHDYHRYVRFGNPGHDHYYSFNQHYYVEQLRELYNEGYAVDKLFEPEK